MGIAEVNSAHTHNTTDRQTTGCRSRQYVHVRILIMNRSHRDKQKEELTANRAEVTGRLGESQQENKLNE